MDNFFCDFYDQQPSQQCADNGFIGIQVQQGMSRMNKRDRVFQRADDPRKKECAESSSDNDPRPVGISYAVLLPVAEK